MSAFRQAAASGIGAIGAGYAFRRRFTDSIGPDLRPFLWCCSYP
ncbi:hypothetical protein PCO82_13810 [Pectobacteriaceae bacterium CE90]|nr:hypothetical protein PCO82_13810 [Pectobacteriaceae bacterium CE90]